MISIPESSAVSVVYTDTHSDHALFQSVLKFMDVKRGILIFLLLLRINPHPG